MAVAELLRRRRLRTDLSALPPIAGAGVGEDIDADAGSDDLFTGARKADLSTDLGVLGVKGGSSEDGGGADGLGVSGVRALGEREWSACEGDCSRRGCVTLNVDGDTRDGGRVILSIVSRSEGSNCVSTMGKFTSWLSRLLRLGLLLKVNRLSPPLLTSSGASVEIGYASRLSALDIGAFFDWGKANPPAAA